MQNMLHSKSTSPRCGICRYVVEGFVSMKDIFVTLLAVSVLGSGAAMTAEGADAQEPTYEAKFAWYDKDKNGTISQQEASIRTDFVEQWKSLDTNGDGQVDLAEFSAFEEANKPDTGGE